MDKLLELFKNPITRYLAIFGLGLVLGAFVLPSKRTEESLQTRYESEISTLKTEHEQERITFQEQLDKKSQIEKETTKEYEKKISTLTTQVSDLKSKSKTSYYKLIKPDGTIEVKKFSETEVNESKQVVTQINEEFKMKVSEIEKKWETTHRERVTTLQREYDLKLSEYQKEISTLKQTKVTEVNKKEFGLEGGILTDGNYYGHATGTLVGPLFMGVHGEFGPLPKAGIGLGVRF